MTRRLRTLAHTLTAQPAPRRAVPAVRPGPPWDPTPQEIAAVQNLARDWVLLWSRWRRTWTAIARFGPVPVIVDDPDPVRLLQRCRAAELAAASGRAP